MGDASEFVVMVTTAGSREEADKLANGLVGEQVAACVQLVPITSYYTWTGEVQRDEEILLLIKTQRSLYSRAEELIRSLHSYDTPEVIAVPIADGSPDYLSWIRDVTAPGPS